MEIRRCKPQNLEQVRRQQSQLHQVAQDFEPSDALEQGHFLGAGLTGGAYRFDRGQQTYVAKQFGHPESTMGSLGIKSPQDYQMLACKQVAVHNALALAGFPAPAAALVADHPGWMVMDMVEGQSLEQLSGAEQQEAVRQGTQLQKELEPLMRSTLNSLLEQHPDQAKNLAYLPDVVSNLRFHKDDQGLKIAGIIDPVM